MVYGVPMQKQEIVYHGAVGSKFVGLFSEPCVPHRSLLVNLNHFYRLGDIIIWGPFLAGAVEVRGWGLGQRVCN